MSNDTNPQTPAASPEQAIRGTLQKLADALGDAAGLTVTTKVKIIDLKTGAVLPGDAVTVCQTDIKIDGDRILEVPVVIDTGDLVIPQAIHDLHERNVQEAQQYRKDVLAALVDFVKTRRIG